MKHGKNQIVPSVLHHLHTLPDGTVTSLSEILVTLFGAMDYENGVYRFGEMEVGEMELCDFDRHVRYEARKERIFLDEQHDGEAVGMPFHCPFTVRRAQR